MDQGVWIWPHCRVISWQFSFRCVSHNAEYLLNFLYLLSFPPFVERIVQGPGYDNVLLFQEMLWTSYQSSCSLVWCCHFKRKVLQHMQGLFCLRTGGQVWELQPDRAHREMPVKPVQYWSLLSRRSEQSPSRSRWSRCIAQDRAVWQTRLPGKHTAQSSDSLCSMGSHGPAH